MTCVCVGRPWPSKAVKAKDQTLKELLLVTGGPLIWAEAEPPQSLVTRPEAS